MTTTETTATKGNIMTTAPKLSTLARGPIEAEDIMNGIEDLPDVDECLFEFDGKPRRLLQNLDSMEEVEAAMAWIDHIAREAVRRHQEFRSNATRLMDLMQQRGAKTVGELFS